MIKKVFNDNSKIILSSDNKYCISAKNTIADNVFKMMVEEKQTVTYKKAVKYLNNY